MAWEKELFSLSSLIGKWGRFVGPCRTLRALLETQSAEICLCERARSATAWLGIKVGPGRGKVRGVHLPRERRTCQTYNLLWSEVKKTRICDSELEFPRPLDLKFNKRDSNLWQLNPQEYAQLYDSRPKPIEVRNIRKHGPFSARDTGKPQTGGSGRRCPAAA